MQKTSLYEEHVKLGAKLVDFAGWEMPIQYKNLKEEVLAVRENCGAFDVSHMGEFLVSGDDTVSFINYLLPCKITQIQNNKAVYSPLCREDGTIIDDLIIYKISDKEIFICVNASNIDKDFSWILKQSEKFNVKVENLSDNYSLIALQGPKSFEVLKSIADTSALEDIDYYSLQILDNTSPVRTMIARTGYTGEDGFEIFGSHEFIKSLWTKLMDLGVAPCGLGSRDVLRLEVAYPLYGNELNDTVTPLESTLKWTIDKEKEDFIGKTKMEETEPKSTLIKMTLEKGIPRTGYKVFNADDTEIGYITSGSMSVMLNKGIAIARVDKKLYNKENDLFVEIRNKKYSAIRQTKAFYSGGHK